MILSTSYKSNQFLWLGFKVLVTFGCFYYIVNQFADNSEISFSQFLSNLTDFKLFSLKNLVFLIIFSLFNWFFEIWKWKLLGSKIEFLSWSSAIKQSLSSLSFSLITPNRIGEYGAKAFFFPKSEWKKVVFLNGIGNGYQLLATFVFGIYGIIFFKEKAQDILREFDLKAWWVLGSVLLILAFIPKITKQIQVIKCFFIQLTINFHLRIGIISFVRYFIFSHQFCFVLMLFVPNLSYLDAIAAITSIYLISSLVPMLSIFDVILKGSVAIWVLSWLEVDASIAISTTLIMWFFNFALPAIIGSSYILRLESKWK